MKATSAIRNHHFLPLHLPVLLWSLQYRRSLRCSHRSHHLRRRRRHLRRHRQRDHLPHRCLLRWWPLAEAADLIEPVSDSASRERNRRRRSRRRETHRYRSRSRSLPKPRTIAVPRRKLLLQLKPCQHVVPPDSHAAAAAFCLYCPCIDYACHVAVSGACECSTFSPPRLQQLWTP